MMLHMLLLLVLPVQSQMPPATSVACEKNLNDFNDDPVMWVSYSPWPEKDINDWDIQSYAVEVSGEILPLPNEVYSQVSFAVKKQRINFLVLHGENKERRAFFKIFSHDWTAQEAGYSLYEMLDWGYRLTPQDVDCGVDNIMAPLEILALTTKGFLNLLYEPITAYRREWGILRHGRTRDGLWVWSAAYFIDHHHVLEVSWYFQSPNKAFGYEIDWAAQNKKQGSVQQQQLGQCLKEWRISCFEKNSRFRTV